MPIIRLHHGAGQSVDLSITIGKPDFFMQWRVCKRSLDIKLLSWAMFKLGFRE